VLIDSNVLLDVFAGDPVRGAWSTETLAQTAEREVLVINALIYSEVSARFETVEALDNALPVETFRREPLPYEAAFLAGRAFLHYRRSGGTRRSPLTDFYIGAHAAVAGYRLMTRDARRYRTYFPSLELIAP
jgi:predicted nucleic acid-binding protein